jgi:hypothetical protein
MSEEPEWASPDAVGTHAWQPSTSQDGEVSTAGGRSGHADRAAVGTRAHLRGLREALVAVYGTDFGIHSPTWISGSPT